MDIEKIVIVTPNPGGDTLTARETHDEHSNQWPAKLQRGKIYKAVEDYTGMYRLLPVDPFPFVVPSGKSVWADRDYLPDYVPAPDIDQEPDPDPEPEPKPAGNLEAALIAGMEAFLKAYWGE